VRQPERREIARLDAHAAFDQETVDEALSGALAGAGGTAVDRNLSEKMRAQSIEIEKLVRRRHRLTQSRPVRSHDQQAAPFGGFDLARVFLIGRLSHTAVTPSVPAGRWFHACMAPPQAPDSRIPSRAPRPRQAGHTGR
jgi:hypothetical protein